MAACLMNNDSKICCVDGHEFLIIMWSFFCQLLGMRCSNVCAEIIFLPH
uniref:Uncharacterized protein n=1 Tax=Rhizophora mucronata TaxID=61149 RepID=A0A2P2PMC3_RHIMU